jgi:pseudolysin/vibriolysin
MKLMSSKMMALLATATTCLLSSSALYAAEVVDLTKASPALLKAFQIQTNVDAKSFAPKGEALQLISEHTDKQGGKHKRYQQYYNGIPVFGYHVLEHGKAKAGSTLSGKLVKDIAQDLSVKTKSAAAPQQTLQKLKADFIKENGGQNGEWVFENEQAQTVIFVDKQGKAHEAHYVSFFTIVPKDGSVVRPYYLVDTANARTLHTWNGLTTQGGEVIQARGPGGNDLIGTYEFGEEDLGFLPVTLARDTLGVGLSTCHFYNDRVKVMDWRNSFLPKFSAHAQMACNPYDARVAGDDRNGAISPRNDALYFGTYTLDTFYKLFGNKGIKPTKLLMNVHFGNNFVNAFWNGSTVTFGDGNADFHPFTTAEVIAHEIGHGITENNSGLIYWGQAGGLNESFSDVVGKAIEAIHNNTINEPRNANWSVGATVRKSGIPFRYFDTPSKDGYSIDHVDQYSDWLDPHTASGIFNRVFFLMSTTGNGNFGESAMMMAFRGFVEANQNYWFPDASYTDAAWGLVQAMEDNYGREGANIAINALREVGIYCKMGGCSID